MCNATVSPLVSPTATIVMIALIPDRVEISITDEDKHSLPVNRTCVWHHPQGLAKHELGCFSADGGAAKSYFDLWLCMVQAACTINGVFHEQTSRTTIGVAPRGQEK